MKKISTSALAKANKLSPSEMFGILSSSSFIIRDGEDWKITEQGKVSGGEMITSQKFGKYAVWPEDLNIKNFKNINSETLLNATAIGENFDISGQRLNLILSELGLIEKDVAGWKITKLGISIGGVQKEHTVSGAKFVLWPDDILKYTRLIEVFNHENLISNQSLPAKENDVFREKFEAKHRTQDGHYVRSKAEMIIDNLLYQYGLVHAYERKLPIEEDVYCDFFIPPGNGRPHGVYIEYWGLENDPKYLNRKKQKLDIYKLHELNLIELFDSDIQNLDDILPRKLLNFKIKVY